MVQTAPQQDFDALPSDETAITLLEPRSPLPDAPTRRVWHKAVQAVHSHAVRGEMTGLMRRVWNALIIHVQEVWRTMEEAERVSVKRDRRVVRFQITMGRLRALTEYEQNNYERLYEALLALRRLEMVFNVMGDSGNGVVELVDRVHTCILFQVHIGQGPQRGQIQFEMPPDTLQMVLEPFPYASLDMRIGNALGLGSTIALYENCSRYWGTRHKLTAVMPVETWISLLAGVGSYEGRYKDFKRHSLDPAIARLQALDAVPFVPKLVEHRGARGKVLQLQFQLTPKVRSVDGAQPDDALPLGWSGEVIAALKGTWGMSDQEVAAIARMASEDEVKVALMEGARTIVRKKTEQSKIARPSRYFMGVLGNVQASRQQQFQGLEQESRPQAIAKPERTQAEFEAFQTSLIKTRIKQLPASELARLRASFDEDKRDSPAVWSILGRILGDHQAKCTEREAAVMAHWLAVERHDLLPLFVHTAVEANFEAWRASQA